MSSEMAVMGDGTRQHGERPSIDEAARALAATLADVGVLEGLTWRLRISTRRRMVGLTIERDASVTVAVPAGIGSGQLLTVLQAKRPWMLRRTAERARQLGEHPAKQIVSGEDFPYLGRNQRLLIVAGQAAPVRREGGRLCLRPMPAHDGARAIINWYTRNGQSWLDPRSRSWAGRIGVSPPSVSIRDLRRRWGMTGVGRQVLLHWALFQLQPAMVDYVLIHELIHLTEPHHGPAFWKRLDRTLPDYQERREHLAELGRQVWLGDIQDAVRPAR
jgi:predicted metal-dependent hydrolase